jgi:competence CoiA-like predicted nuclease
MTKWHAEWQSQFPVTEVPFRNKYGQIKERRADVVIPEFKRILEIQHSPIENEEVGNRNKDYALHDHSVVWLIDGQEKIIVKNMGGRRILSFESTPWLYEHFLSCDTVYYDVNGFIYQVDPKNIKSYQIDVLEPQLKSEFIIALQTRAELFVDTPPQSYLHVKQQGAGSGKTFGIMQLLNTDPEITHYQWILFITKQHSAVNVMHTEFKDQHAKGLLTNLELLGEVFENKKYIVHYRHKTTNQETCAVFATVDSFAYAVGQASQNASDQFVSIIKSIVQDYSNLPA